VNCVDAIAISSARIANILTPENYGMKVPSCPEWTLLDLVIHVGQVQEFWSNNIREANADARWSRELTMPESDGDASTWMRNRTKSLIDAINFTSDDAPCWTWWKEPRTAKAVSRHQVQEAEVHRWDAELTIGQPKPLPLEIAIDGLTEYLFVHRFAIEDLKLPHIQFEATDTVGNWHINAISDPAVTARGTASDLALFLNGRLSTESLTIKGNPEGLQRFASAIPEINS
jgi:uncharacterized protein (TIGR03083 family)